MEKEQSSEANSIRSPRPTRREIMIAMLELRADIKNGLKEAAKKAPRWDPDADRVIIGPSRFPEGKVPKDFKKPLI